MEFTDEEKRILREERREEARRRREEREEERRREAERRREERREEARRRREEERREEEERKRREEEERRRQEAERARISAAISHPPIFVSPYSQTAYGQDQGKFEEQERMKREQAEEEERKKWEEQMKKVREQQQYWPYRSKEEWEQARAISAARRPMEMGRGMEGSDRAKEIPEIKPAEAEAVREQRKELEAEKHPEKLETEIAPSIEKPVKEADIWREGKVEWYSLPDNVKVFAKLDSVMNELEHAREKLGADDLWELTKELGLDKDDYRRFRFWERKEEMGHETLETTSGRLRRYCDELGIPYERIGVGDFPKEINRTELSRLWTHTLNEGSIHLRVKGERKWVMSYTNEDPVLVNSFKEACEKLGSAVRLYLDENWFRAETGGMAAGVLKTSGYREGKKTIVNPELPKPIREDFELWQRHFGLTIPEEGSIGLYSEGRRLRMQIRVSRGADVTEHLPSWFIEKLEPGVSYCKRDLEHLAGDKWSEIEPILTDGKNASKLLKDELETLKRYHSSENAEIEDLNLHLHDLHFSKKKRVTISFGVGVSEGETIDLFARHYRPLEGTWKGLLFDKYYEVYIKLRGKRLSDEDLSFLERLKAEYPSKGVPKWWKEQKLREFGWKFE